jgi:hypothetical protein
MQMRMLGAQRQSLSRAFDYRHAGVSARQPSPTSLRLRGEFSGADPLAPRAVDMEGSFGRFDAAPLAL